GASFNGGAFGDACDFCNAAKDSHLGASGDVQASFYHAVVAQGDADARVSAKQATLTDGDGFLTATGQGAHDGSAAANIRAIADDNAREDTAFDHRRIKHAIVEVDEVFEHHVGAISQVSAEADAVRVTNAHTGKNHVVNHAWELVHGVDVDWAT